MPAPKRFSTFYDAHPLPVIIFDEKTESIIGVNKAGVKFFGYPASRLTRLSLRDVFELNGAGWCKNASTLHVLTRPGIRVEVGVHLGVFQDRSRKFRLMVIAPTTRSGNNNGQAGGDKPLRSALDAVEQAVLLFDRDLRITFANRAAIRNTGFTFEEFVRLPLGELFLFPDELGLKALLNSLQSGGRSLKLRLRITRKDGSPFDAEAEISSTDHGKDFVMTVDDVSEQMEVDKKKREALHEKDTLIKEIHHRVKNNLQLISSILYLKLTSVDDKDIQIFLEDTRQKIHAIGLVHERLFQKEELLDVEASDYLGQLVRDIQTTWIPADLALKVNVFLDRCAIPLDTAIMCGLILNELLTNAIRHAFPGRHEGVITVIFRQHKGSYLLSVSDNGVGLPDNIKPGQSDSFGMQLIDIFIRQLGGRVEIIGEQGTNFQIHF